MPPRRIILGTAGHIDHGKTALVRALTGTDTDRLPQEKQRGITIDLGFAHLEQEGIEIGIVDVPGHERFIRNMLAGSSGIDCALLVIAADDSVMPQTREHLAILRLLGITRGVIALTKCDLVDTEWIPMVADEARSLVEGSFLEAAPIVSVSSVSRAGISELTETLFDVAAGVEPVEEELPFRMAVDRSFLAAGLGTIVTGSVWSGAAVVGDALDWQPRGASVRIRGLQTHGRDAQRIEAGQRAAINISGAHHKEIVRGHELATPGSLRPTNRISVRLEVLSESGRPVRHRSRLRLHLGTTEVMASVRLLRGTSVDPGATEFAQLITSEPVVAIGRQAFVVRSESPVMTLGGGIVLQTSPLPLSRRDPDLPPLLARLASDQDDLRIEAAVEGFGAQPWTNADLCREAGVSHLRAQRSLAAQIEAGAVTRLQDERRGEIYVHRRVVDRIEDRLMHVLRDLHESEPLARALPRQRIQQSLEYVDPDLLRLVMDHLLDEGRLQGDEQGVADPARRPVLTAAQEALAERLRASYKAGGFRPPTSSEFVDRAMSEGKVRRVLEFCAANGDLVHLGHGLYLHHEHEGALRRAVSDALRSSGEITVSEVRDLLDTTRKFAVPFCEYLDRAGVTARKGDVRVLVMKEERGSA